MLWTNRTARVMGNAQVHSQRMTNERIEAAARQIDEFYDSLLYSGMPLAQAVHIEQQRDGAHAELTRRVLAAALNDW